MKKEYQIFVYSNFADVNPSHRFTAIGKRQVVGLMKTIMDNFNPVHVDIMSKQDFYHEPAWKTQ